MQSNQFDGFFVVISVIYVRFLNYDSINEFPR